MLGTLGGNTPKPEYNPLLGSIRLFIRTSCVYFIITQGIVHLQQSFASIVEIIWPTKTKLFPTAPFY